MTALLEYIDFDLICSAQQTDDTIVLDHATVHV